MSNEYALGENDGLFLCLCPKYKHWYVNIVDISVCQCGHPMDDHLRHTGSCLGVSRKKAA